MTRLELHDLLPHRGAGLDKVRSIGHQRFVVVGRSPSETGAVALQKEKHPCFAIQNAIQSQLLNSDVQRSLRAEEGDKACVASWVCLICGVCIFDFGAARLMESKDHL